MSDSNLTWFEKFITLLLPTLKIRHQRWRTPWEQRDRQSFLFTARFVFVAQAVVSSLHFFYVDIPLNKVPLELWARYRFSIAFVCIAGLVLTYTSLKNTRFFRWPLAFAGLYVTLMQSESMVWRAQIPYAYSIICATAYAVMLRRSVFESVLFTLLGYAIGYHGWMSRPDELPYIYSAAWAGLALVIFLRARMSSDVDAFIAEQEKLETQSRLIEAQEELNDQIRAFLPREIYRRLSDLMSAHGMSVLQAMDEVLRPREAFVACLYSDIRRSTAMANDVDQYLEKSLIPSQRLSTEAVEHHGGIPKLAGDMVFAYFDSEDPQESLRRSLLCAIELVEKKNSLNDSLPEAQRLERYALLSFGKAVVGNIGDSNGSIDVTAVGAPSNIVSRLDQLAKDPKIASQLTPRSCLLTHEAGDLFQAMFPELSLRSIDLKKSKLLLRDFPQETHIYLFEATSSAKQALMTAGKRASVIEYLRHRYEAKPEAERARAAA